MKHETEKIILGIRRSFENARSLGSTAVNEDPFFDPSKTTSTKVDGATEPEPAPPAPSTPPASEPQASKPRRRKRPVDQRTLSECAAPLIAQLSEDLAVGAAFDSHQYAAYRSHNSHEIHIPKGKTVGTLNDRAAKLFAEALKDMGSTGK